MSTRFFEENILDDSLLELSSDVYNYEYEESPDYSALSGKVIIGQTGEPVSGARIIVNIGGTNLDTIIYSDSKGFFNVPFDLIKYYAEGTLNAEDTSVRGKLYYCDGSIGFSATKRTNLIITLSFYSSSDGNQYLETLNTKDRLTIKLVKNTLPSSLANLPANSTTLTPANCKNYFNLSVEKQSDRSLDTAVATDEIQNAFEYCASINALEVNVDDNYINFIFTPKTNELGYLKGTPHCFSIGTLSLLGDDAGNYNEDQFQVSENITLEPETKLQEVVVSLFPKITNVKTSFSITINFLDANGNRYNNSINVTNLNIYCGSLNIYNYPTEQAINNGTTTIGINNYIECNEYDLITVQALNFYPNSFILSKNPQPNDGYTIDLIYGNKRTESVVSSNEEWHLWTTYAMPWYKKTMNVKYYTRDINSGNKKDFTEFNVSIFNVRNTNREIDDNEHKKLMSKFENNQIYSNTYVNQIYVVRNKTINGKYYTFVLPYYQECYPSYMITKMDNLDNIELHRYVNTYLDIKYRSNDGTDDYYVDTNDTSKLSITYLSNELNDRQSIDFGGFNSNKSFKIDIDPQPDNNILRLSLKGNSDNNTGNIYKNLYISPVIPNNLLNEDTIKSNIVLLSSVYKTVKCHNELLEIERQQETLEYTYNYSYDSLNIGNYNYKFTQDTNITSDTINNIKKNKLIPDVSISRISDTAVNNTEYSISGSNIVTSATLVETDSQKNKFINDGSFNVTFTYDNTTAILPVTYNVVSNPKLTVSGISFTLTDNTYTITYTSELPCAADYFNKANEFTGNLKNNSNYSLYLITSTANDTNVLSNEVSVTNLKTNTVALINDKGITTYTNYKLNAENMYSITYSLDLNNWNAGQNEIIINGGQLNSNIVCYKSSIGAQSSPSNVTYIANVVENDMLGYIYTTNSNKYIYSSNEIESNINKYYIYNDSLKSIEYINSYEYCTDSANRTFTYVIDSTNGNDKLQQIGGKFINVNYTTDNSTKGIYASFIGEDLHRENDGFYITSNIINQLTIYKNTTDICKADNTIIDLINNKLGHCFISTKIYSGVSLLDKFQTVCQSYFKPKSNNSSKYYYGNTEWNDYQDFIDNYKLYLGTIYNNTGTSNDYSYDVNANVLCPEITQDYINYYNNTYISQNPVFSRNNNYNSFDAADRGFYTRFIRPYEDFRDVGSQSNQDDVAFKYSYHATNTSQYYGGNSGYFQTLKEYFESFTNDDDYNTTYSYIESMYYAYGIAYNYVYHLITESASYYEITNDAYKLKLQNVNYSNTNIRLADGTEITRPTPMPTKFNVQYSSGVTWGDHIISEKLSFITDYNTSMCNYYNLFFTKDSNGSLTVSDIYSKFTSLHLLSDISSWTNSNIYTKYNTLISELTNKSLYIKFSNNDYNYNTIKTNISNYKNTVDLFNSICANISTLLKISNGDAEPTAVTITYSEANWQNIISLFKSFKTVSAITTVGNYYVFNKPADFNNELLSGEYDKIYILTSIYNTYKVSPIVTIVDNLAGIHHNSDDDTLCGGIYNAMYTGTSYYQDNRFIVNELLKNINTEASKICNRFNEFVNYSLTNIFNSVKTNIDNILSTANTNTIVYLEVNNFDILYNFTLNELNGLLGKLANNGQKILIKKYLIRAYNYSKQRIAQSTDQTNAINEAIRPISSGAINNELDVVKTYLENIILNINDYNNINLRISNAPGAQNIDKFSSKTIHRITIKTIHYNGYNIYYSNDLDFIQNNENFNIRYGLYTETNNNIVENIHSNNIYNTLSMFNGTIRIDVQNTNLYLYMFIFYHNTFYKQIHFNTNLGDDSYIKLDSNIYSIENNISHTLNYENKTLSITFDVNDINTTLINTNNLYIELYDKRYSDNNWSLYSIKIATSDNVINKTNILYSTNIEHNIYIFKYRIRYEAGNNNIIYSPYKYFAYMCKLDEGTTYNQKIVDSSSVSLIGNLGRLYLTKNSTNNKKWYWVADISNYSNNEIQFKLINNVYSINNDGTISNENIAQQCSPRIGSRYYSSNWNSLVYCLNNESANNYKHELRWKE